MTETPRDPADLIEDIHQRMDEVVDNIEGGAYESLPTILPKVEALCREVMKLPVEQALPHRAAIEEMIARLDELKQLMEQHRDQVGEQARGLGGGKAAAQAYRKSSFLPKKE